MIQRSGFREAFTMPLQCLVQEFQGRFGVGPQRGRSQGKGSCRCFFPLLVGTIRRSTILAGRVQRLIGRYNAFTMSLQCLDTARTMASRGVGPQGDRSQGKGPCPRRRTHRHPARPISCGRSLRMYNSLRWTDCIRDALVPC